MRTNELDHLENHVLDFKSSGMDCAKSRCPNNKIFKLDISSNFFSNFLFQRVKLFLVQISYYYQVFLLAPYSKLCVIRFSRKNHSPKLITLLIVGNKTIYIPAKLQTFSIPSSETTPFLHDQTFTRACNEEAISTRVELAVRREKDRKVV